MEIAVVEKIVRPVIEQSGFELYDIEYSGRALRIFIEKEGGVNLSDIVEMTRLLSPLLDVEDVIPGSYELEISSPGLERVLRKAQHFEKAIGRKMKVKTRDPMSQWNGSDKYYEARRQISAELKSFDGQVLVVTADDRETKIPFDQVVKAQVIFELETSPKKGKKPHGSR